VDVAFDMSDGSTAYQIIGLPEPSSAWANFTTTFTVPQGAVDMTVYHLIHSVGTLTLDDESLTTYKPTGFNRALVSLTFDDGYSNEYTQALPLLQKYGFNSTQFIITSLIGTNGYMTTSQLQSFQASGSEMASHTVTHDDMLTETPAQYDSELSQSQAQLQQWLNVPVTDLAFPEGLYNQAIVTDTKNYYAASRGVEDGLNSKDNFNAYDIKVQNVYNTTTTAQVADWVAQAQATKTWLVLVYHSVDPNLNNPVDSGIYNITPDQLDSQLAVVKSSGVSVLTMQQALAELKPQL
jgi:peptidoglycan/xylan/chitin deacetylase (PgdA/CDA1 family)